MINYRYATDRVSRWCVTLLLLLSYTIIPHYHRITTESDTTILNSVHYTRTGRCALGMCRIILIIMPST